MTAKKTKKTTKKKPVFTELSDGEWLVDRPDGKRAAYFGYAEETVVKKEREKARKGKKKSAKKKDPVVDAVHQSMRSMMGIW